MQLEQAKSHVKVKQARPLFPRKLKLVAYYIASELEKEKVSLSRKFILLRDQAFFKLVFSQRIELMTLAFVYHRK